MALCSGRIADLHFTIREHQNWRELKTCRKGLAKHMRHLPLPEFQETPYVSGPPVAERRVALVSTAGLSMRGEAPFGMGGADYRVIPGDAGPGDIVMSHISVNL